MNKQVQTQPKKVNVGKGTYVTCKSQDFAGEIGTAIWVGKRSENTDFRHGTTRRIIPIPARRMLGFTPIRQRTLFGYSQLY
jgi:hypothetical protein